MKRIYLYLVTLLGWQMVATAQSTDIPRFIPPSPEVSALFRYLDYPVGYSTGIPEISIPIYTIQCGSLSLPITINYHSGGRRFSDLTGSIGLGWILNAGGAIERTVYGRPDEQQSVPINIRNASTLSLDKDYNYIAGLYYSSDSEYDIFSYSLPNLSGYFVLKENVPTPLTLNDVKIEGRDNFIITDKEGNKYNFTRSEYTYLSNYSCKTSWYLTSIVSANGMDNIHFTYINTKINGNTSQYYTWSKGELITVNDSREGNYRSANMTPYTLSNTIQEVSWNAIRLSEISFRGGKVTFDIHPTNGYVTGIHVKDANGKEVKTFSLTQSLLDKTLMSNYKLDKLSIVSGNSNTDTYQFEYYPTTATFLYKNIDYWGFLNGNQGTLIPSFSINWCDFPGNNCSTPRTFGGTANRTSNENEMKKGILKKITYPTGGSTEFTYEANKAMYKNMIVFCGGLRIKQIKTTDDFGKEILRTFVYGSNGYGTLIRYPDIIDTGYESFVWDLRGNVNYGGNSYGYYRKRVFSSGFSPEMAYYMNEPIFYSIITEYMGDVNNNEGKTVYEYTYPYSYPFFGNLSMPQTQPTTWGRSISGQINFYTPIFFPEGSRYNLYSSNFSSLWKGRKLSQKIEYKKDGNSYVVVKSTSYKYEEKKGDILNGLKIYKYIDFPSDTYADHRSEELAAKELGSPVFLYNNIQITTGVELLSSVQETDYLSGEALTVKKNIMYDPVYNLQTKTTLLNSNGDSIINNYYYPFQAGYSNPELTKLNMYAFPVKETKDTNGKTESVVNQYTDFGNNMVKLSKILTQQGNNPEEKRIEYFNYDTYGNPLYLTKDNADQVVYLWGYNYQSPIAEIKNATFSDVCIKIGNGNEQTGKNSLETIAAKNEPAVADWTTINSLRNSLPNAQVTTYTYKPLVGIATMTDPRGVVTKYDYDAFGRLMKVTQADKVIESYDYHYKE